jgi:putative transposase
MPIGFRPLVQAMPSLGKSSDERWATDLYRVFTSLYDWANLAVVIDCYTRELLSWHLSRSAKATTAETYFKQALINRYGTLGQLPNPLLLRTDKRLVFTTRCQIHQIVQKLWHSTGIHHNACIVQNGLVERAIRTIKEQCMHRQRIEKLQHASGDLGLDWVY